MPAASSSTIAPVVVANGRYTIGRWPDWTATAARTEARRLRHQIDQGHDPLADLEAEREAPTVNELCDRFEAEHLPRLRASSAADYKRMLTITSVRISVRTSRCRT